jgi:hypothetical protein
VSEVEVRAPRNAEPCHLSSSATRQVSACDNILGTHTLTGCHRQMHVGRGGDFSQVAIQPAKP